MDYRTYNRIMAEFNHTCAACGCRSKHNLCVDHVNPRSNGLDDSDSNLQVLCQGCNIVKGELLGFERLEPRNGRKLTDRQQELAHRLWVKACNAVRKAQK